MQNFTYTSIDNYNLYETMFVQHDGYGERLGDFSVIYKYYIYPIIIIHELWIKTFSK